MHLAGKIARELLPRLPAHFEFDDLEAAGQLGLLHAAERYRPGAHGGAPFEAFARAWIRCEILSTVRREWSSGEGRHGFKPLTEGLPAGEEWGAYFDARGALEAAIDDGRRTQTIAAAVETLPEAEKGLLRAVYSAGAGGVGTVRAAAAVLGIPESRAYRLHNSGLTALRARFNRL
jgi:RNA polymerase sigma factor (sigma-70 family)